MIEFPPEPSALAPRRIRLRRPPRLLVLDEPFVPSRASSALVDARWTARQRANPALFDGRLLHVLGVHRDGHGGATVHAVECAYRYHAVSDESLDTGVRPLGVRGYTVADQRVLLGRRAPHVDGYPGCWEFAPAGRLEPGAAPERTLCNELVEETGIEPGDSTPVPLVMLFDPIVRTWEIVYRLDLSTAPAVSETEEYEELRWIAIEDLRRGDSRPTPLSGIAVTMLALLQQTAAPDEDGSSPAEAR